MPPALTAALYLRDASGLKVKTDSAVPPLEPRVDRDSALIAHATEQAAEAWDVWWSGLLERNPEFRGVPPLVPDPLPELPADLRALISIGLLVLIFLGEVWRREPTLRQIQTTACVEDDRREDESTARGAERSWASHSGG
jgi:hypothetical protein